MAVARVDGDLFAQRHPGCSAGAPAHGARPGALTRDRLTDTDLFTAPLTFMGVPHGRPGTGNRAAALGLVDCGNVRLTPGKIFDALERTEQAVAHVEAGAAPIPIGGDRSVTVPVARAVGKRHGRMAALHIDSHTDSSP